MNGHQSTRMAPVAPNRKRPGMSDEPTLIPGTESPADEVLRPAGGTRPWAWGVAIFVVIIVILLAVVVLG